LYLELAALHPDELEYHVRLASLYHRNNMLSDLENQLSEIRRLNPEHALLILGDTSRVGFDDLVSTPDSLIPDSLPVIPEQVDSTVTEPDTQAVVTGSEVLMETEPQGDPADALPDTTETLPPSVQEQDPVQP